VCVYMYTGSRGNAISGPMTDGYSHSDWLLYTRARTRQVISYLRVIVLKSSHTIALTHNANAGDVEEIFIIEKDRVG